MPARAGDLDLEVTDVLFLRCKAITSCVLVLGIIECTRIHLQYRELDLVSNP